MKTILLKSTLLLAFISLCSMGYAQNEEISFTWMGGHTTKSFYITATKGQNFTVDWGDGNEAVSYTGTGELQEISQSSAYDEWNNYSVIILADEGCSFTMINLDGKFLKLLNISKIPEVIDLSCYNNQLTSLDVTNNTKLKTLSCGLNQLTSLDVSNNTELTYLDCSGNQLLTTLDVSKNTALTYLDCSNIGLTTLDVSKNTLLSIFQCRVNDLTSLDVSNNTELILLSCLSNQITSLDITKNAKLEHLECSSNQLTSLDISNNKELIGLSCSHNLLISLNLTNNTKLEILFCYSNQLTTLDVTNSAELTNLYCPYNQLTSLDISKNTKLTSLSCSYSQLTSLDISNNIELTSLSCYNNDLTSLDISNNKELRYIHCYNNHLPLSNLYVMSSRVLDTMYDYEYSFGTQTFTRQEAKVNQAFSLAGEMNLGGIQTEFSITKEDNVAAIEGIDYSLDYDEEAITFLVKGDFEAILTNNSIASNSTFPAKLIIPFTVTDGVAIEEVKESKRETIELYPNPAAEYVRLSIPEEDTDATIRIFDTSGKLQIIDYASADKPIYVGNLPSGVYFYSIKTSNGQYSGKLLVSEQ